MVDHVRGTVILWRGSESVQIGDRYISLDTIYYMFSFIFCFIQIERTRTTLAVDWCVNTFCRCLGHDLELYGAIYDYSGSCVIVVEFFYI